MKTTAAVIAMMGLFMALACGIALKKSNTWDESAHLLAGYAYLNEGMDYLSPLHHPVTGRSVTALFPTLLLNLEFNNEVTPEQAPGSDFFPYSIDFIYKNSADPTAVLFLSRLGVICISIMLGVYIFVWSNELWGRAGALLSLFFYILSPNILAHSSISTTDLPVTAFFFITVFYIYRLAAHGPSFCRAFFCALFMALALTTKHTALLLPAVLGVGFAVSVARHRTVRVITTYIFILAAVYVLIWAVYGFRYHSGSYAYQPLLWDSFSPSAFTPVFDLMRSLKLLPEAYLYSIAGVLTGSSAGRISFLMGEYSYTGWWYYFPVAFLIKTPIATLFLVLASAVYIFFSETGRVKSALVLLAPALLVFVLMCTQKVNIGLRHVLPVYPFLFTFIGFVPNIRLSFGKKALAAVLGVVCVFYAYSTLSIYPHQLAYFNEFIGGPANGYKYLVDSNLDWGQDLKGLKKYMDRHNIDKVKLAYFGLNDPSNFGMDYEYLPSYIILNPKVTTPEVDLTGYFAISATMLQGVYLKDKDFYKTFRETAPVDTIGYSIFIYRFDEDAAPEVKP